MRWGGTGTLRVSERWACLTVDSAEKRGRSALSICMSVSAGGWTSGAAVSGCGAAVVEMMNESWSMPGCEMLMDGFLQRVWCLEDVLCGASWVASWIASSSGRRCSAVGAGMVAERRLVTPIG